MSKIVITMSKIVITIDSTSEAELKIENRNATIDVDIQYKALKRSFKTQRDAPLRRMLLDFCDSLGLVYSTIRFSADRRCRDRVQIKETETADELGIADGDTIYADAREEWIDVHIMYERGGKKYSFNTHMDVPLGGIFRKFSDNLDRECVFIFGGHRIRETQTPRDVGMDDGDLIDAFQVLRGGAVY